MTCLFPQTAAMCPLQTQTVYGVNGLCGAGKSHAAIEELADRVLAGERWIVAGPTADQTTQFYSDLCAALNKRKTQASALATLINSETVRTWGDETQTTVAQRFAYELTDTKMGDLFSPWRDDNGRKMVRKKRVENGRVILVTHALLFMLPSKPTGWHLLIDEAPAAAVPHELTLPVSILDALRFRKWDDGTTRMYLQPGPLKAELDRVQRQREELFEQAKTMPASPEKDRLLDDGRLLYHHVESHLRDLYRRIKSGNWWITAAPDSLTTDNDHGEIVGRMKLRLDGGDTQQAVLASVLDWTNFLQGWASVTIMAANLEETFAAMTLRMQGHNIAPHPILSNKLRYQKHPNGHELEITYISARNMSKTRKTKIIEGKAFGDIILEAVQKEIGNRPFCWSANNDVPDTALNGERMPFTSHGLNRFMHHDCVAVLNISNLNPQCAEVIESIGFTKSQIRNAIMNENVYQAICRSKIRDISASGKVTAIVPDLQCAEFIAERFPGCTTRALGTDEPAIGKDGRPRIHVDNAAKMKAARLNQKTKVMNDAERYAAKMRAQILGQPIWEMNIYDRVNSRWPTEIRAFASFDEVVAYLRTGFDAPPETDKTINPLFLQGVLQGSDEVGEDGQPTGRAKGNIASRSSLWFDIETLTDRDGNKSGQPIPAQEFVEMFKAAGIKCVAYSSFNHASTPTGTRYRLGVPLSHAVGPEAYECLVDLVVAMLQRKGWFKFRTGGEVRKCRFSGVDPSKRPCNSIFYAPMRNAGRPQDAFFVEGEGEPLDVVEWLSGSLTHVLPANEKTVVAPVITPGARSHLDHAEIQSKVASKIAAYCALPSGTQNGGIFQLAVDLRKLRLTREEIAQHLEFAASRSHSREDRSRDVKRILTKLR